MNERNQYYEDVVDIYKMYYVKINNPPYNTKEIKYDHCKEDNDYGYHNIAYYIIDSYILESDYEIDNIILLD